MELALWIPVLSLAFAGATFFIGRMTAKKAEGEAAGELKTDIKYIKESVQKIERRMDVSDTRNDSRIEELSQQIVEVGKGLSKVEESSASAHKRLDEHIRNHKGGTYHE